MTNHKIADTENEPTIAIILGDGVGPSFISQTQACIDLAVEQAFAGQKRINWLPLVCGEQAACEFDGEWFPEQTLNLLEQHKLALLGPITAPLGYGFRSLNLALRHELGLNLTQTQYRTAMGVFELLRDNTEDLPIGLEWDSGSFEGAALKQFLLDELGVSKLNLHGDAVFALKAHTKKVTEELVYSALERARETNCSHLYFAHQANKLILSEGTWLHWVEQTLHQLGASAEDNGCYCLGNLSISLLAVSSVVERLLQNKLAPGMIACSSHSAEIIADTITGFFHLKHRHSVTNFNSTHALFEPAHGPFGALRRADDGLACLSAGCCLLEAIGWTVASQILLQAIDKVQRPNSTLVINDVQLALQAS